MTKREVKAWAQRLTRIWAPEEAGTITFRGPNGPNDWPFSYKFWLSDEAHFRMTRSNNHNFFVQLSQRKEGQELGYLGCQGPRAGNPTIQCHELYYEYDERFKQFAAQWMDIFRRGCWLSGCDIEATAHEKAEWMQDFSREELEAWNLKI